jgi:hypothetical protein
MQEHQWENNKEWLGKRLSFIWHMFHYRPSLYLELKLNDEKCDFYEINDTDVSLVAKRDFYSADFKEYEKYFRKDYYKMAREYNYLLEMKEDNLKDFLSKNNCNKYDYLMNNFENFQQEYYELKQE